MRSVFERKINNRRPGWLWAILRMNQLTIRAWSQAWKCIYLVLRDIEVRDDTGKMCAPVRSVAILLSCLFWQCELLFLMAPYVKLDITVNRPRRPQLAMFHRYYIRGKKYTHKLFACISEYDVALTRFSLQWVQNFRFTSFLILCWGYIRKKNPCRCQKVIYFQANCDVTHLSLRTTIPWIIEWELTTETKKFLT